MSNHSFLVSPKSKLPKKVLPSATSINGVPLSPSKNRTSTDTESENNNVNSGVLKSLYTTLVLTGTYSSIARANPNTREDTIRGSTM